MTDETSVAVAVADDELDRLRRVTDDPAGLLRQAGIRRVRLEETIAATFEGRDDRAGPRPHCRGTGRSRRSPWRSASR